MAKKKESLDTEVNLISFIALLAVLICSLLLTVSWIQIGSMNVKQALDGSPSENSKQQEAVVWAKFNGRKDIIFSIDNATKLPRSMRKFVIPNKDGAPDLQPIAKQLQEVMKIESGLRVALIQPAAETFYEEIVQLMDQFKASGMTDLGISPL